MPHRLTSRTGLAVLAVVPVLGLAACGSDKKDSNRAGGYGSALSKDDFVKQANAFCKSSQAELDKLTGSFSGTPTKAQTASVIPTLDKQLAKARAIVPPSGELKVAWDTAGTGAKAAIGAYKQAAQTDDDAARLALLQQGSKDSDIADSKLTAAGVTDCGKDS